MDFDLLEWVSKKELMNLEISTTSLEGVHFMGGHGQIKRFVEFVQGHDDLIICIRSL